MIEECKYAMIGTHLVPIQRSFACRINCNDSYSTSCCKGCIVYTHYTIKRNDATKGQLDHVSLTILVLIMTHSGHPFVTILHVIIRHMDAVTVFLFCLNYLLTFFTIWMRISNIQVTALELALLQYGLLKNGNL